MSDGGSAAGHTASLAATLGAFSGWLPPIVTTVAGAFAIVWYAIAIWESLTVKGWRARVKHLFGG